MNAKDYLLQIQKLDRLIENKMMEVAHWKGLATKITAFPEGDRVQSSGSKQTMENAICKYIDMENETLTELAECRQGIIKTIDLLPKKEYDLIQNIYVHGKSLKASALDMGISGSWASKIHKNGLKQIQKILNEREKQ